MLDLTTSHVYYSKKETFVKMYDDFKDREGWYKPKQYAPDDYFLLAKKELTKIIEEYSQDHITLSCGYRAENLFALALATQGFIPVQKKVKEFNGRKWTKTNHDLDYIFKEKNVTYGCEIKNTLGYLEKEELEIKLEMCKVFNIRPLFILRFAPKIYIELIRTAGGYTMIFECQIYDLSQVILVEKIKSRLGLPVDCPKAIPEGIIIRFNKWHLENQKL